MKVIHHVKILLLAFRTLILQGKTDYLYSALKQVTDVLDVNFSSAV